jgi:aminopeptidase N
VRQLVDMATYVGAHELGHQWWAHQVIGDRAVGPARSLAQVYGATATE